MITGLDNVPDIKIKDVSRACGKTFSSGASINDIPTGGKEVIIQGDVYFEVAPLLIKEFKIAGQNIYLQDDSGSMQPYE